MHKYRIWYTTRKFGRACSADFQEGEKSARSLVCILGRVDMLDNITNNYGSILSPGILELGITIIALSVLVLLLRWVLPPLKAGFGKWYIRNRIKKLGNKALHNVRLPDGMDGEVYIDHLVLKGDKIIVVDVKQYDGLIYGNETLSKWTQVVNRKNFHFSNPLIQIKDYVMVVQTIAPDLNVEGAVLFAGRSHFPKRVPEGVLKIEDLPTRSQKGVLTEQALLCWQQLREFQQRSA